MPPEGYSESRETGWKDLEKSLSPFPFLQARSAPPEPLLTDVCLISPPEFLLLLF